MATRSYKYFLFAIACGITLFIVLALGDLFSPKNHWDIGSETGETDVGSNSEAPPARYLSDAIPRAPEPEEIERPSSAAKETPLTSQRPAAADPDFTQMSPSIDLLREVMDGALENMVGINVDAERIVRMNGVEIPPEQFKEMASTLKLHDESSYIPVKGIHAEINTINELKALAPLISALLAEGVVYGASYRLKTKVVVHEGRHIRAYTDSGGNVAVYDEISGLILLPEDL